LSPETLSATQNPSFFSNGSELYVDRILHDGDLEGSNSRERPRYAVADISVSRPISKEYGQCRLKQS
jgi:hypothetical protein